MSRLDAIFSGSIVDFPYSENAPLALVWDAGATLFDDISRKTPTMLAGILAAVGVSITVGSMALAFAIS